jgi:hypothetical protein
VEGVVDNMKLDKYCDRLVGRVYKLLCIREEDAQNAKKYLESFLVELKGASKYFGNNSYFASLIFSLEGIRDVTDYNLYKRKIFECINIVNKIKKELDESQ